MNRPRLRLMLVFVLASVVTVRADEIDDWVKSEMQVRHVPAISIAVVKNGVLVKAEAYGVSDLEHNIPAQPNTVFKIGSTSKQFLAAGVMILVQDGKIAVDEKLGKYLDGIPEGWNAITIRHLLTHTSGLAREGPGFDPYKIQPDIDVIKSAYLVPLHAKPGDQYEYSNLGYFALAEVIHRVSGKPWDEFLRERVFKPLGMNSTRITTVAEIVKDRASGYIWSDDIPNAENWLAVRPSGAFLSTASDMAKWEIALQSDRILTPESKKQMWTPVKLNNGSEYPYGFGWEVDHFPNGVPPTDVPMIRHEGSIPGFRAVYWRLPDRKITVIVLSNLQSAALDKLTAGIALRYDRSLLPAYQKRWPDQR